MQSPVMLIKTLTAGGNRRNPQIKMHGGLQALPCRRTEKKRTKSRISPKDVLENSHPWPSMSAAVPEHSASYSVRLTELKAEPKMYWPSSAQMDSCGELAEMSTSSQCRSWESGRRISQARWNSAVKFITGDSACDRPCCINHVRAHRTHRHFGAFFRIVHAFG